MIAMPLRGKRYTFAIPVTLLFSILALWKQFNHSPRPVHQIVIERPSLCRTASVFRCGHCIPNQLPVGRIEESGSDLIDGKWTFQPDRDAGNYRLTDAQCDTAFPGLFEDINAFRQARSQNPIKNAELSYGGLSKAMLRVMIYDDELYVIRHPDTEFMAVRTASTLHALYRAILTSPSPLPNIEFTVNVGDFVDNPNQLTWSYTRTADDKNTWLMPDYGFWSYGEPHSPAALGSWQQVRQRTREVDESYSSFKAKIPKAFWRGEILLAEDLRTKLLEQTANQPWADVKPLELHWGDIEKASKSALPIHDHCKYMFLLHTEGNSYSGRLKYLQNCRSLIFAHTLEWIQPFEYLMVPSGPNQNYVEVSRDFGDLPSKIKYYLEHLDEAERIANNSIATFRDRYNTPAAETCYWRKLIRAWGEVSFKPEFFEDDGGDDRDTTPRVGRKWRGTPFQNYAVRRQVDKFR